MQIINIHEAKTNLSKLIKQTQEGKEVVIGKAGNPVAKLIAYKPEKKERTPGVWEGRVWMSDDFNDEDKVINRLFYGE